eukprot:990962-Rhodomonas_salina.1
MIAATGHSSSGVRTQGQPEGEGLLIAGEGPLIAGFPFTIALLVVGGTGGRYPRSSTCLCGTDAIYDAKDAHYCHSVACPSAIGDAIS